MSDGTDALVTVDDHLARILAAIEPLPAFPQPLMETLGMAVAEDVVATIDLPSFDNSAMDGYAVRHTDVATASDEAPVHLPVVGEIGAGQARLFAMSPGTAVKIMTGAPVPAGADTVVPYEWTDRGVAQVRIDRAPTYAQHVRPAGVTCKSVTCSSPRAPCSARATSACSRPSVAPPSRPAHGRASW